MKIRMPGLQGKFIIALLVAAALPFVAGFFTFETIGYRRLLAERGKLHQVEAITLKRALDQASEAMGEQFHTWLTADPTLLEIVALEIRESAQENPADAAVETRQLDEAWPFLPASDPRMISILRNPGSDSLARYRTLHPEVAEIMATDTSGRLVAATGKTSDYDQADEEWWQKGAKLTKGAVWTDQLHFDTSSGVFSLDVIVPLYKETTFVGVAKLSVDVTSLFARLAYAGENVTERWEIVLPDGRTLARSKRGFVPLSESIPHETLLEIERKGEGWTTVVDKNGRIWMAGFTDFGPAGDGSDSFVVFSSPRDEIVAPLRRSFLALGAGGAALLTICALVGYYLIHRNILQPLASLGAAARSISATAKLDRASHTDDWSVIEQHKRAENQLKEIMTIHTGDEIEFLAGDFAVMTSRVLRYHHELESEVAAKTSVIHEDLEMAREFQYALLPLHYPQVPPPGSENPLRLEFAHFYQPATTVGGDFFDLLVINDNCAGILIADVMGHGARSALITAILRALVRTHSDVATDPGLFLTELNRHLHEVISRSGQTLFVTAFFLVLDTRNAKASWAVAGHPAPLLLNRHNGGIAKPLWTTPQHQPALGLIPKATFRTSTSPLAAGDLFLLYTDGAIEAENSEGQEFGVKKLGDSFQKALDGPLLTLPTGIITDVTAFQRRQQYEDDVCLVAVEAVGVAPSA